MSPGITAGTLPESIAGGQIDVRVRVLGPIEAERGGKRLHVGGDKQQHVLGLLAATGERGASAERLAVALYGEWASTRSVRTVHTYVSNLRSILGTVIRRDRGSYVLALEPQCLDSMVFESIVYEGRALAEHAPDRAFPKLEAALALWAGEPYGGLDGGDELYAERARLEQLRLMAIAAKIEAELVLGRHSALVPELSFLTAMYPLREDFVYYLMLALEGSGLRCEALSAFQTCREVLREEIGAEPSRSLWLLEEQIRADGTATADLPALRSARRPKAGSSRSAPPDHVPLYP